MLLLKGTNLIATFQIFHSYMILFLKVRTHALNKAFRHINKVAL